MGSQEGCSFQLIDGNGTFNGTRLDNFIKQVQLGQCGVSYAVISIMGPQSSGKSTLLNHLFGTNFREMNAIDGKSQTTKGIWLANCVGIEPRTIVMDVEGTDGRERGQDDTAFEKQSALFALAVSDIVLLNMWCHAIGLEQAANKPLLRTVFQVMMTLFSPRKVTLMFVIRDKSKTPFEKLKSDLINDIHTIWDSVPKPQAHNQTPLGEFFNVRVVALPNYETNEDLFKKQVATLRQQFFHSIAPGGLAGDRRGVVPASGFSLSAEGIWGVIKENKDLNLPKHKVIVATIRCEEISMEKFVWFSQNKDWCEIKADLQSGPVSGFGMKLSSLLKTCLSDYDAEATFYDEGVRNEKRKKLEEKLLRLAQSAYTSIMMNIKSKALLEFKEAFGEALEKREEPSVAVSYCTTASMARFEQLCADADIRLTHWGTSKKIVKDELQHEINDIAAHISDFLEDAKQDRKYVKRFITGAAIVGQLALGNITSVLGLLGGSAVGAGVAEAIGSKMKKSAIKEAIEEIGQGSGRR